MTYSTKTTLHPAIHAHVKALAPDLNKLALQIHSSPELGFQEKKACRLQVRMLKNSRFKVESPFLRIATAFRAVSGRGRPAFCLMSEYDALPRIGHACGHNLIAGAAVGAGQALAMVLRDEKIPGKLVVMGTPAEEGLGGKVKMVQAGALKGLDAAIMAHPFWRTGPDKGSTAVTRYRVTYHGRAAHAAASPEMGLNALDAVMLLFQGVNAWRQQLPESSRVHGIVTNGGVAPNIIPDLASCYFYLRATDDSILKQMTKRFADIVEGAARMTGAGYELKTTSLPYRARRPNTMLNDAYVEYARLSGLNPVIPKTPGRGSSDFGDVSQAVPGAHVYFGVARKQIAGHSMDMLKAAKSAYGLQQMLRTAETLANVGYRFFTDEQFRNEIAGEFAAGEKP